MKKHWIEVELGKVCKINMGQSPPSSSYNQDVVGTPFFQGKAEFGQLYPKVKKWTTEPKKIANKGDILLSVRAPVGATNLSPYECCIGRGLAALYFKPNNRFLYYFLVAIEKELDKKGTGTTFRAISGQVIRNQLFPLPPLPEQRSIVAKIETLFSELDNGIENLKQAQQKLKIYRQSVLKKAFEGELTSPKTIRTIQLGELIEPPRYGTSKKCSTLKNGKAVLRIPNIGEGKINSENLKYAEFDTNEITKLALQDGDILTIRSNGSIDIVGKCALIYPKDLDFLYAGYLIRLRPKCDKASSKYLLHCLSSHALRIQIESKAKSTSGVNNINAKELCDLQIPICSIEEQTQIVQEIESRLSVVDSLEQSIKEQLIKAEALRQSILKKAFSGELLTDTEVKSCMQEPDWEPAEKLLEKIKSEK